MLFNLKETQKKVHKILILAIGWTIFVYLRALQIESFLRFQILFSYDIRRLETRFVYFISFYLMLKNRREGGR